MEEVTEMSTIAREALEKKMYEFVQWFNDMLEKEGVPIETFHMANENVDEFLNEAELSRIEDEEVCEWKMIYIPMGVEDGYHTQEPTGCYSVSCKEEDVDFGPEEFCQYCGKPIKVTQND
jgi:hypothetical protein